MCPRPASTSPSAKTKLGLDKLVTQRRTEVDKGTVGLDRAVIGAACSMFVLNVTTQKTVDGLGAETAETTNVINTRLGEEERQASVVDEEGGGTQRSGSEERGGVEEGGWME